MGDLDTTASSQEFYFIGLSEVDRILNLSIDTSKKISIYSDISRINALYMIARAGSGHIGTSFSSMEIISWILFNEVKLPQNLSNPDSNIFFSSKGHDAPALYSVLIGLGALDFDNLHKLRKLDGLPGHPDISTQNIVTNTGSLGLGISKAKGMILSNRLSGNYKMVYVLMGDGELQEGQVWESLISAANNYMEELILIVDHNKIQSDCLVKNVSDLGDIESKFKSFGWDFFTCDGNNVEDFRRSLNEAKLGSKKPKVILANTIKGKGVSFFEGIPLDSDIETYKFHSGAPSDDLYQKAVIEITDRINKTLNSIGAQILEMNEVDLRKPITMSQGERLIPSYERILVKLASLNKKIVALDADLALDTGLMSFKENFPERFIECGIAEQDMVSQAGGFALSGYLPIVHSFSCFLTARASEQIYNNSTEKKKIIYVGSLAGILPSGPGHSHQSVRDIALMSGLHDMIIIEPVSSIQLENAMSWVITDDNKSAYIRLTSVLIDLPRQYISFPLAPIGQGTIILDGLDVILIVANGVLLSEAIKAAELLMLDNISTKLISMSWLNRFDLSWFQKIIGHSNSPIITVESHNVDSGFGISLIAKLTEAGVIGTSRVKNIGLSELPRSGQNAEILLAHNLDYLSLAKQMKILLDEKNNNIHK